MAARIQGKITEPTSSFGNLNMSDEEPDTSAAADADESATRAKSSGDEEQESGSAKGDAATANGDTAPANKTLADETLPDDALPDETPNAKSAADEKSPEAKADGASAKSSNGKTDGSTAAANPAKPVDPSVNVILVSDIDLFSDAFFRIRGMGRTADDRSLINVDNVTFVLNVLDTLASDERFLDIRKRRPKHRSLAAIEEATKTSRSDARKKLDEARQDVSRARDDEQQKLDEEVKKIDETPGLDEETRNQMKSVVQEIGRRRLAVKAKQAEDKFNRDQDSITRDLESYKHSIEDKYKLASLFLPLLVPWILGMAVYFNRRSQEREGVSRNRLR